MTLLPSFTRFRNGIKTDAHTVVQIGLAVKSGEPVQKSTATTAKKKVSIVTKASH